MSGKSNGKDKKEPENRAKGLKEKMKKSEGREKEEEITGVTHGALRGLGKVIPGLNELVKGLEKSEAFQERMRDVDAEIEQELVKATAIKRVQGTRKSIIPPRTTLKGGGLGAREGIIPRKTITGASRTKPRKQTLAPPPRREIIFEVLDEGDNINVIAELPGFTERGIEAQVKDNLLLVHARGPGRQYQDKIKLPCPVENKADFTYRNGVLQIILNKLKV